jgi:hypothetical protein
MGNSEDVPTTSPIVSSNKPAETKQANSQTFPNGAPTTAGTGVIASKPRKVMTGRLGKF